jgi:hypothetical protein
VQQPECNESHPCYLQVQKAKLEEEISSMAEEMVQLRGALQTCTAQSVKTELVNEQLSQEVDSMRISLSLCQTAVGRAATQNKRSCAFIFAGFERTRLQDVWDAFVLKCR